MMKKPDREEIVFFLKSLRDTIIAKFEQLEPSKTFQRTAWDHHSGGGGEISLIRGDVFEKAAVNWSGVEGKQFPLPDKTGPFFATGVSLITHMMNPHAPTVHMNVRYIETKEAFWFGGGYDLTPMGFSYAEDTAHFHNTAQNALSQYGPDLYPRFSQQAKEYFYIPHRKKERGVGGIFFDHYQTGHLEQDMAVWKAVAESFLPAIWPIYQRRIEQPYTATEKQMQNVLRAHYAEFNLAYDRGTRFGFNSNGNPEAILCSMPPTACW